MFARYLAATLFLCISLITTAQVFTDPTLAADTIVSNLSATTQMQLLNSTQLFVTEKVTGRVKRVDFSVSPVVVDTILDLPVANNGERGLLGLTLDPDFAVNGLVYLFFSNAAADGGTLLDHRIVKFHYDGNTLTQVGSPILIFPVSAQLPNGPNHNGGILLIGPDDKLYGVTGDMGRALYEQNQNTSVLAGTGGVFRLNLDGSIPGDNPFASDSRPEIKRLLCYGVRNSYGMAFDPLTDRLWITDNGQETYDEINRIDWGANCGWNKVMGPIGRTTVDPASLNMLPGAFYHDPTFSWASPIGVTSIIFLHSDRYSGVYRNKMWVGDNNFGKLYVFTPNAARDDLILTGGAADRVADSLAEKDAFQIGSGFPVITDMEMGPDGYLYVLTFSGRVNRIRPANPPATISGTVTLGDYSGSLTGIPISLMLMNGTTVVDTLSTTLDSNGSYSVTTPTLGTWQVVARATHWLSIRTGNASVSSGAQTLNLNLPVNGDTDDSNEIDDADITNVILDFGGAGGTNGATDIDGSGTVDDADLTIIIINYGLAGIE